MGIYQHPYFGRGFYLSLFGVFALVAAALAWSTATNDEGGPSALFAAFWLGALMWNAYWWLFRFAFRIEVREDHLRWEAPLRSGTVPLADITEVRPLRSMPFNPPIAIRHTGPAILVLPVAGIAELVTAIERARPDIPTRLGLSARYQAWMGRRWRSRSAWHETGQRS